MTSKSSYYLTMTHKWSKARTLWLNSTQLVMVIIVENIGIRLEVESNIGPLFDPNYWPNIEYFSNNKARSSYLPKIEICPITNTTWYARLILNLEG